MAGEKKIRVLVTRAAGQGSALVDLLAARGMEPVLIPTIEIGPPSSFCGLDAALTTLRAYEWVVFTSANAVCAFAARAKALGVRCDPRRIAVVGPATAKAVEKELRCMVDLMPSEYVAEALAEALVPKVKGASVLLVRAAVARDVLPEALLAAGAGVTIAEAYRNVVPTGSSDELRRLFAEAPPEAITFTSASTAVNLAQLLEVAGLVIPSATVLVSIGPVTSGMMRKFGWEPTVEAREATVAELVRALAEATAETFPHRGPSPGA